MNLRYALVSLSLLGCAVDIPRPAAPPPSIAAVFDPLASPSPMIPLPNDLAKTGGDGVHLNVPSSPTDSPAQMTFNAYLNTLDGFPSSTPGSFSFSGAIDPTTLTAGSTNTLGSVVIFDATAGAALLPTDFTLTLDKSGANVTITPTKRWLSAHEYVVVVFGGDDPAAVKGAMGEVVLASPAFFFLRSPNPVEGVCGQGDTLECVCPASVVAAGNPNDTTCHSVVTGLPDAQARVLEGPRQTLSAGIDMLLPAAGATDNGPRSRNNIVLMWNFTIASSPMAVFDPTRGDVPFPNDILINQTTGLVNLPIAPGDPQAANKMGLNTLDGFSTTAAETLGVDSDGPIDAATVVPKMSAFMLGVTSVNQPDYSAAPVFVNMGMTFAGQIAVQPSGALESDQTRYAVVVTTDVKDKMGRNLVPPPLMVLIRGMDPLVDANGHSTVPSVLGDSDAQQLEVLRQSDAALFDGLGMLGIPRDKIAAAWTFTTESIMRPLMAVAEVPKTQNLSTNVTIVHSADAAELATKAAMLPFSTAHLGGIVIGTMSTEHISDPTTRLIQFSRDTLAPDARFTVVPPSPAPIEPVRFAMALPNTAGPWPVAILQHGIFGWRGDMSVVMDSFAAAGWATIAIDLPFHGARSACTDDTQCGTSCDKTTGQCMGGFKITDVAQDPTACAFKPLTGDDADCLPLASGAALLDPSNLFASRDNLRQFVLDGHQLLRVIGDTANPMGLKQSLPGGLNDYAPDKLGYLGHSLGGMVGADFLSVAPTPTTAVLNVTGGHIFDIIAEGSFASLLTPLLTALNIQPDTPEFLQLRSTAIWILDPVDPFAVGAHLVRSPVTPYLTGTLNAPKQVIVQEAGMDATILPQFEAALAGEILGPAGLDANGHAQGTPTGGMSVSTYFADAVHSSLISTPATSATTAEQAQAIGWISSSGMTLPSP